MRGGKREGAGRPVGSKNKYDLLKLLNEIDFDFTEQITGLLSSDKVTTRERIEIIKALLPYIYAKREQGNEPMFWSADWK